MKKSSYFKVTALSALCALVTTNSFAATTQFTSIQTDTFNTAGSVSNAWGDYDKDGDLDFLVSIKGGEVRLYRNDDGHFVSVGKEMGLPTKGDQIRGVSWGDYDNDGDLDILGGSNEMPIPSRTYVFRNDGAVFKEVAESIGLAIPGRISRQSNWIDYDNDGDSDLYAANRTGANRLLKNENGIFKPLSYASGVYDSRRTVGACWFDIDNDGDLDFFLANQSGDSDTVARNDIDKFVDIAPELGMDETQRLYAEGGVGCATGDYNNDGFIDLYVTTYGANLLYKNNGDGSFSEVGKAMGVVDPDHAVAAAWGDYNNDGYLDLIAVGYHKVNGQSEPYGKLYRNTGTKFEVDERYPELTAAGDHGVEWIDFDDDGDLDLSVTDGYGKVGGHFVFRNEMKPADRAKSLSVLVLDSEGNYTQQGAVVKFYDAKGKILGSRIVSTGGGYNAQSARPVYFSLPKLQPITVEVNFMGNEKLTVDVKDITTLANKPLLVHRPAK
ncbi:MAG: VCBS repeat-containing protein [Aliiglaciecola sp.]|uniref:FG-GAP repeat domain-containing protein n=1 Tax=Aliiglaciecola sp. TaxID=1872441 RepID=UPI0032973033